MDPNTINTLRLKICTIGGVIGGFFVENLGGWDKWLETLIIFMVSDYITGMVLAAVWHRSPKTEDGALDSRAGYKGLIKKCGILLAVLVAYRFDLLLGMNVARNATVVGFIINETVSIMENLGLMGVPFPEPIQEAISLLSGQYKSMLSKMRKDKDDVEDAGQ